MAVLRYKNPNYVEGGDQPQWLDINVPTNYRQLLNEAKEYTDVAIESSKLYAKEYTDEMVEWHKQYTDETIAALVDSAPETLNTLNELATAINENSDVIGALNQSITNKQDKGNYIVHDGKVTKIVAMTQSQYNALSTKDSTTLYIITDA